MGWTLSEINDDYYGKTTTDSIHWIKACIECNNGHHGVLNNGGFAFPVTIIKRNGLNVLECLGQDFRSIAGPLNSDCEIPTLREHDLPKEIDLIDFRRFPENCIDKILPDKMIRIITHDVMCYTRKLDYTPDTLWNNLSRNAKHVIKKARNRLKSDFPPDALSFETLTLSPSNWDETWSSISSISKKSWQGKSGLSVFCDNKKTGFLRALVNNDMLLEANLCRIHSSNVAVSICITHATDMLIYLQEYDHDFEKYSIGHLLNYSIFCAAASKGITSLDFGIGDSQHKSFWRFQPTTLYRVMVPLSIKGHAATLYQCARWKAGRLVQKLKNTTKTTSESRP